MTSAQFLKKLQAHAETFANALAQNEAEIDAACQFGITT